MLAADKIYTVGTIRRGAKGFPDELKTQTPQKGEYICKTVGHNRFFVFNDRKVVCFVTNAFPEVLRRKLGPSCSIQLFNCTSVCSSTFASL